jgi:two-component system, OmpR family, sensor kinase
MKGPRTLFGRLLIVFLLFGIVMTGALLYVMRISHAQFHKELDQSVNRGLAREYVDADFLLVDRQLDASTLHQGIRKLASANPGIDIYLLDDAGRIVESSVPRQQWLRSSVALDPIRQFLTGAQAPVFGDDPRTRDGREVFSAATFHVVDCPGDYLYLVLGRTENAPSAAKLRTDFAIREGTGIVILAAVLAVALSLVLLRLLTHRLGVLERTMSRFGGDASDRAPARRPWTRGDEIDRLDTLFKDLAARIERQMTELQSVDAARREMLANLSHDLRTPITTLMAHLESLQMEEPALDEVERREYLGVAMRQARRISQLVEQLLEAAKLEAGQVVAKPELFPIGELLHDVSHKFTLAARERGVTLAVRVVPERVRVHGDIALLERTFDNLLDNALRHTPAGGNVEIRAEAVDGGVKLSVVDSGDGMTAEEAARVFDRFYRGDTGRSTTSGQAGLGLAIVKSILDLHGSRISVESRPGAGTTFSFELPANAPQAA